MLISWTDLSPIPVRSAVKSYLTQIAEHFEPNTVLSAFHTIQPSSSCLQPRPVCPDDTRLPRHVSRLSRHVFKHIPTKPSHIIHASYHGEFMFSSILVVYANVQSGTLVTSRTMIHSKNAQYYDNHILTISHVNEMPSDQTTHHCLLTDNSSISMRDMAIANIGHSIILA